MSSFSFSSSEGTRRCSMCGINYPLQYVRCQVCKEDLAFLSNVNPDKDWREDVERGQAFRQQTEKYSDPIPATALPPNKRGDELFFAAAGVRTRNKLRPGDVVQHAGTLYEVMGYWKKTRLYWVKRLSADGVEVVLEQWAADG